MKDQDSSHEPRSSRGFIAISVDGLVKRYGSRAVVDGLSFQVQRGEVFALLGPNGAGKTTTVEILEGYRTVDGGSVRVLGLDPRRDSAALKRRMGFMLQQGGIYPQLAPIEALKLFAAFYPEAEDPGALLERVGLQRHARTRFRQLSGGERQRLSLALALVGRPELVFLDEPTAAMDPQARRSTWGFIRDLRQQGVTVLLTTHFMDEAEQLADRVAIISHGRLVALDTPAGLRRTSRPEIRFRSEPLAAGDTVAEALGIDRELVRVAENEVIVSGEPTPERIARLAAWLASQDCLLTELHTGAQSLEQVFLALTSEREST